MARSRIELKAVVLALVATVTSLASPNSFAALQPAAPAAPHAADPQGVLTASGSVTINGNVVQTGATVTSGAVIATGQYGTAVVDLGPLGRLELRPESTVRVRLAADSVDVDLEGCASIAQYVPAGVHGRVEALESETQFTVRSGKLAVANGSRALNPGDSETVAANTQLAAAGDTSFDAVVAVGCKRDAVKAVATAAGTSALVWLAVGGGAVAATVATVVATDEGTSAKPPSLSPRVP
jgi:hypothetical protein